MSRETTISGRIVRVPDDYDPLKDKNGYMNDVQLAFFKLKLEDILAESEGELSKNARPIESIDNSSYTSEESDRASIEDDIFNEIRRRERVANLTSKIRKKLIDIDNGIYGFCIATGEEIGIPRLLARPMTDYCVTAQAERENMISQQEKADHNSLFIESESAEDED